MKRIWGNKKKFLWKQNSKRGVLSRSKKVDLVYFILFLIFILFSIYFSIFRTTRVRTDQLCCHICHNLMAQSQDKIMRLERIQQKIQEQMTSYNMDTTCWPHGLHMIAQGRVHSSQHRPSVGLYKIDQFVEEFSIKFSCVTQYKSCSIIQP